MKLLKFLSVLILTAPFAISCTSQEHKHTYDFENGKWFWSETETGYSASFTVFCGQCDENTEGHRLELEATVTKTVNNPTCTAEGATIYTATVEYGGKSYTDTKQIAIDMLDHNYTSISVEGNYPKTYQAFDTFDDSGLTVKVVCENCGDEVTVPHSDYYIIYNTFGMDYLSAGDTSVTISYQGIRKVLDGLTVSPITVSVPTQDASSFTYDGTEKVYAVEESEYYTVTGNKVTNAGDYDVVISLKDKKNYIWNNGNSDDLVYHFTVNKAANEITGLEASYNTICGTKPDFSGVTSTANDIVLYYYRDSAMTDEVQESELSAGTYYMKAVSGGANYEQVVKTATLTVNHSFECEVAEEQYIKTVPTEDNNAVYYKSCYCGLASTTETFVLEGSKLPTILANSSYEPSEIVNEVAPEGYYTVSKGTVSYEGDLQGKVFLKNLDISNFSQVSFAFKTENRRFCDSNWGNQTTLGEWYFVTITNNFDGTFTSVVKDVQGNEKFGYKNKNSFRESLPYYNWDGDQPFMDWYSTEVIGLKLDPVGEFVAASSVSPFETISDSAPKGYTKLNKKTISYEGDLQGKTFLADIDIHEYSSVYFAFKTENRRFCDSSWGNQTTLGAWYFVTITNNNNGTYTSVVKDSDGNTKFGYENKSSFKDSLPYYNWDGSAPFMVWISTEVRGTLK